jgi:hypothetical protein
MTPWQRRVRDWTPEQLEAYRAKKREKKRARPTDLEKRRAQERLFRETMSPAEVETMRWYEARKKRLQRETARQRQALRRD